MTKEEFFCYDCFQGEYFMKRICIALLFLLLISVCSLMASPIYKSFTVNGETVSRWVIESSVFEFDEQGNIIHYKTFYDYEAWYEYDAQGNEIHYKNSDGHEIWNEYDAEGNNIHYKNSNGYEERYEYDADGHKIHYKDSDGNEKWYEYEFYPSGKVFKEIIYERF